MRRWAALAAALAACTPAATTTTAPARGIVLDGGGLHPAGSELRIDFGRAEAGTVAAVARLAGARPVATTISTDCGAGPVRAVRFGNGLELNFQRGAFRGWVASAARGAPATAAGIAPGTPRAAVEALPGVTVRQTSLGAEFETGGVFGLFDEAEVGLLWAGVTCFFR